MKQIPLAIGPESRPSFDNFVPGANAAAVAHLAALAPPAPPVYLWGPAASGKTHLLQALVARWQAAGHSAAWFDAADAQPWVLQAHWSLVVVDRCEQLSPAAQHAAFALFEAASAQGVQWLAAGRLPPVDLPLRDDLRTRLGWGLVFEVKALSDDDKLAALRHHAASRQLAIGDDVFRYLLTHWRRDLSSLITMLDTLDRYSLAMRRPITVPLVKNVLQTANPGT